MTMKSDIHQKHKGFQKFHPEQNSKAQAYSGVCNCKRISEIISVRVNGWVPSSHKKCGRSTHLAICLRNSSCHN